MKKIILSVIVIFAIFHLVNMVNWKLPGDPLINTLFINCLSGSLSGIWLLLIFKKELLATAKDIAPTNNNYHRITVCSPHQLSGKETFDFASSEPMTEREALSLFQQIYELEQR